MSVAILTALRDAIAADLAINVFFSSRYDKSLNHLIGYEKGSANAKDRPLLCYVPAKRKYDKAVVQAVAQASIVIQIIEQKTENGIKDGTRIADEASEKLVSFLAAQPVPAAYFSGFGVVSDLGSQQPFYECEIYFSYQYRKR